LRSDRGRGRKSFKRSSILLAREELFPLVMGKVPSHGSLSVFEQFFDGQWPEPCGGAAAADDEPPPVGAEGQGRDWLLVAGEDACGLTGAVGLEVPEPCGLVLAALANPIGTS